jgi:hypothetical protein
MDPAEKILQLETKFNERWDAHDRRSDENWNDIKGFMG